MIEIYDAQGNKVMGVGSNLTRVVHVYKRGKNSPEPQLDAKTQALIDSGKAKLAVLSGTIINLDQRQRNELFDLDQYQFRPWLYADVAVWGVYND